MRKPSTYEEPPRKRLESRGAACLSDAELLALILRPSAKGKAVESARALLESCGGLHGLLTARVGWNPHPGIGPARLAALSAAVELGRRLAKTRIPSKDILDAPAAVASYLALRYGTPDHEVLGAIYLDLRHRPLADVELYRGTLNQALVEPRAILKEALVLSAKHIVLFHTHPSGNLRASEDDLVFTRRMVVACELVGIRLLEHLIVTNDGRWRALSQVLGWNDYRE